MSSDRATMIQEVTMAEAQKSEPEQQPDAGRVAIDRAAAGQSVDAKQERGALDYLLGSAKPLAYTITVDYETEDGMKPLTFHFRGMDAGRIDKIEQEHIDDRTNVMDKIAADTALVYEATTKIVDDAGGEIVPKDERFRSVKEGEPPLASGADAMRYRFGTQAGLLAGVATAIREKAGWDRERVGKASRLLVAAAGN